MFELTEQRIEDLPALAVPAASGSVVAFWGRVRDHNEGRAVTGLEYSAYPALALKEGHRILEEALGRFGLDAARAILAQSSARIAFMTAYATEKIKQEIAQIQHLAYIEKPVSADQLRVLVEQVRA